MPSIFHRQPPSDQSCELICHPTAYRWAFTAKSPPVQEHAVAFKARRRLAVVSDSQHIEGFAHSNGDLAAYGDGCSAAPGRFDAAGLGSLRGERGHGYHEGMGGGDAEDDERIPCIVSSYAGYSKKGYAPYNPRKRNQDALIMAEDPSTASLFLAVLDGHGEFGDKAAQVFRRHLAPAIFDHPDWEASPETAVAESIASVERKLLDDPSVDTDFSGTTLVSVCIRGTQLVLTNVGDSRITLGRRRMSRQGESVARGSAGCWGRGSLVAQPLTEDHKPDTPTEKQRILCAGGRVFSVEYADGIDGPPRVWLGNMDTPGLAMSRSLGDAIAHTAGVTSDPDTYRYELDQARREAYARNADLPGEAVVLILATDGLWEFVTDQEAVDIASECSEPRQAVERLIHEASERWMKREQVIDDTTVCVAFFKSWAGMN